MNFRQRFLIYIFLVSILARFIIVTSTVDAHTLPPPYLPIKIFNSVDIEEAYLPEGVTIFHLQDNSGKMPILRIEYHGQDDIFVQRAVGGFSENTSRRGWKLTNPESNQIGINIFELDWLIEIPEIPSKNTGSWPHFPNDLSIKENLIFFNSNQFWTVPITIEFLKNDTLTFGSEFLDSLENTPQGFLVNRYFENSKFIIGKEIESVSDITKIQLDIILMNQDDIRVNIFDNIIKVKSTYPTSFGWNSSSTFVTNVDKPSINREDLSLFKLYKRNGAIHDGSVGINIRNEDIDSLLSISKTLSGEESIYISGEATEGFVSTNNASNLNSGKMERLFLQGLLIFCAICIVLILRVLLIQFNSSKSSQGSV